MANTDQDAVDHWATKGPQLRQELARRATESFNLEPTSAEVQHVGTAAQWALEQLDNGIPLDNQGRLDRTFTNTAARRFGWPQSRLSSWIQERPCQHGSILFGILVTSRLAEIRSLDGTTNILAPTGLGLDVRNDHRTLWEEFSTNALAVDTWWAVQAESALLDLQQNPSQKVAFLGNAAEDLSKGIVEHLAKEHRARRRRTDWGFNAGASTRYLMCVGEVLGLLNVRHTIGLASLIGQRMTLDRERDATLAAVLRGRAHTNPETPDPVHNLARRPIIYTKTGYAHV